MEKNWQILPTPAYSECKGKIDPKLIKRIHFLIFLRFQSKKIDLYLRGEPDYLQEDWLAKSVPIQMENVVVIHQIRDQTSLAYFNLLNNFNVGFTLSAIYLFFFFIILSLLILVNELAYRIRSGGRETLGISKRVALALGKFRIKRLSAIAIFVLFVQLFLWMTQLFLTNNIKTNKVVSVRTFSNIFEMDRTRKRIFDLLAFLTRWSTLRS